MIDDGDCREIDGMKIGRGNGENLPQRHFVHHKSHMTRPGLEPGTRETKIPRNLRPTGMGQQTKELYYRPTSYLYIYTVS
jgi:hypothetical protein